MRDIRKLLLKGHAALAKAHAEKSAGNDNFRVGSSGAVIGTEVYGTCHRIAHLRNLGVETPQTLSQDIMFKDGEMSEEFFVHLFKAAGIETEVIQHEELRVEIDGVDRPITGHPDIILRGKDGDFGLELKRIFGWSTVEQVWIKRTPKTDNILQAAAYSHFKDTPFCLVYVCPHFPKVPHWDKKKIADRLIEEFGNNWMEPFYAIFYMEWRDDTLYYRHEAAEWVKTEVTKKSIEDYYRLLTEMRTTKQLGPRVNSNYLDGTENKWGVESNCGLCKFKSSCDAFDGDKDYDRWLETAKETVAAMPRLTDFEE